MEIVIVTRSVDSVAVLELVSHHLMTDYSIVAYHTEREIGFSPLYFLFVD